MTTIIINNTVYICGSIRTEYSEIQTFSREFIDVILEDVHSIDGEPVNVQGGHLRFTAYQPTFKLDGADEVKP